MHSSRTIILCYKRLLESSGFVLFEHTDQSPTCPRFLFNRCRIRPECGGFSNSQFSGGYEVQTAAWTTAVRRTPTGNKGHSWHSGQNVLTKPHPTVQGRKSSGYGTCSRSYPKNPSLYHQLLMSKNLHHFFLGFWSWQKNLGRTKVSVPQKGPSAPCCPNQGLHSVLSDLTKYRVWFVILPRAGWYWLAQYVSSASATDSYTVSAL